MRVFHEYRSYESEIPAIVGEAQNLSFVAHWHHDVEMVYVLGGSIRVGINRECRLLLPGDFAVCGSGEIHYYDTRESSTLLIIIFRPEFIGFPGGWPDNIRFHSPFIPAGYDTPAELTLKIGALFASARDEFATPQKAGPLFLKSRLLELCALAARHLPAEEAPGKGRVNHQHNLDRMQKVLSYLEQNMSREICLVDAARQANLSLFHFSRLFNSTVGMSFTDYLNTIRVQKAESLIRETGLPITEIALECGFESIRTFNRAFKQIKGIPPSRLRMTK